MLVRHPLIVTICMSPEHVNKSERPGLREKMHEKEAKLNQTTEGGKERLFQHELRKAYA